MDGMAFQARDMIARDSNCDRKAEYKNGRETSAGQPRAWRQKQQQPQSPGLSRWFVVMRRSLLVACALVGLSWQLPGIQRRYTNDTGVGPLRFADDGTFQVSVFEDLHFGENAWDQWGPQQDINSIQMLNKVLDFDLPDLVVLNGDLITGENTFLENSTTYIDMIVGPMVERGLPWASTYGNHDHNHNISGEAILAREHMWPGARTRRMVPGRNAGITNYYLPVYAANCTDCAQCAPELLLWFFDSRGGFYFQEWDDDGVAFLGQPNWVDASVVEWFQQTNAKFVNKYQRTIPSLAFVHIPTNASLALQTQAGVDPNRQPGINDDYPLAPQAQGWCVNGTDGHGDPDCRYGGQDVPFMQAIATTPGLMAVFSGHDHGATWCYRWDELIPGMIVRGGGVSLCFGQHSGYGGYGNWIRGARQIIVDQDRVRDFEIDTYIRLESGAAVGSVTLNSTYNEDVYPATPNDMTYCPTCEY